MSKGRLGLLAVVAAVGLALPADGVALLDWHAVRVTPNGPVPRVVRVYAPSSAVAWWNDGGSGSRVVFPDGSCDVAVGASSDELTGCMFKAGRHPYTIEGVPPAVASGVIVSLPGERSVSIAADRRVVTFGEPLRLSGFVRQQTSPPATVVVEPVSLFARAFGATVLRRSRVVRSGTAAEPGGFRDGWSVVVRPSVATAYQVRLLAHLDQWSRVASTTVAIRVRPRVTLSRVGGTLRVRVEAGRSFAGRTAVLQRQTAGRWAFVARARLDSRSRATFAAAAGTLRTVVAPSPGYLAGASAPVRM